MAAFARWAALFLVADGPTREQLLPDGIELARQRRVVLAQFIRADPQRALADAVPMVVRQQLPVTVLAQLEDRVGGKGTLSLIGVTPLPGETVAEPVYRVATIGGQEYRAYAYGQRGALSTLSETSLLGIAVDNAFAVSDSPVRVLEPGELAAGRPVNNVCVISGLVTPAETQGPFNTTEAVAVEAGGEIHVLCHVAHVVQYEHQLTAAEEANYAVTAAPVEAALDGPGSSTVTGKPSYAWSHGVKKLLIIIVDFSDVPGVPVDIGNRLLAFTPEFVDGIINGDAGVNAYYNQCSYGQAGLAMAPAINGASPDIAGLLRMPQPASFYATSGRNDQLHTDAENLAAQAGFNIASYDRIGVVFSSLSHLSGSQITYGGLGQIIGRNFWINGDFRFQAVAHELGHTFGLNHASLWVVTDGNPVSPTGTSAEYGDLYDIMGFGAAITNQFNQWGKSILGWIPDSAVTSAYDDGIYRVYQFDTASADLDGPLALKVVRNSTQNYWIGYRGGTTSNSFNNGAYVLWGYNSNQKSNLLALSGLGTGASNAPLPVGTTFNDPAGGVTLKTVAKGSDGIGRYLDVQVAFQPRIRWTTDTYYVDKLSGNAVLTLLRSGQPTGAISVHFATSNGTATSNTTGNTSGNGTPPVTGNATTPRDFLAQSGDISWADGDSSPKTISIPLTSSLLPQNTDKFLVSLSNPSGALLALGTNTTVNLYNPGVGDPKFKPSYINNTVNRVLVLPDGSVLAGGWFSTVEDTASTMHQRGGIARYTSAGTLDLTFGTDNGGVSGGLAVVECLAVQPDGKILLGGNFTACDGQTCNGLSRLNPNGTVDGTFNASQGANGDVYAVLVQPDGKVLIGGSFTAYNGTPCEYLARLNADGSLDSSFTGPDFGGDSGGDVRALTFQADGKILIGGTFYLPGDNAQASVCRLNANGSLDADFTGVVAGAGFVGQPGVAASVYDITTQPDGKILIAGAFTAYNGDAVAGIARLNADGARDLGFAVGTGPGGVSSAGGNRVLVQPDGKILLGGSFSTFNDVTAKNFVRLNADGSLDTTFAAAQGPPVVHDFALQPDGRIVYGSDWGTYQNFSGPMFRFFSGIPMSPGAIQWSSATVTGIYGVNATLTVSRVGGTRGTISAFYSVDATTGGSLTSGVLTWADGDSTDKTVTLPLANGVHGSFSVNLVPGPGGAVLLGATRQVSIAIIGTNFADWQTANFSSLELSSPQISGATATPAYDGLSNLVKYAFNLNPHFASRTGLPMTGVQTVGGNQYVTITFRRRNPTVDLTYTPEASATPFGPWTASAIQVGSPISNGDGTETVTYRDSVALGPDAPFRFLHVRVVLPP